MRNRLRPRLQHLILLEAVLTGLFFIQTLRFLIGALYSRVGAISILSALDPTLIPSDIPGVVDSATVSAELSLLVYALALPLLTLVIGRVRWLFVIAAALVAVGRALMIAGTAVTPVSGAALAFGGGLLYLAMLARHRAGMLPYSLVLAFGLDQLLRAAGNTLDPTWFANARVLDLPLGQAADAPRFILAYLDVQLILSALLVIFSLASVVGTRRAARQSAGISPDTGLLPLWGGIGFGGLLFIQLSLLALPNAAAGRSGTDYTILAPLLTLATLLPVIPYIRRQTRRFIAVFDGSLRGWLWMLLLALLIMIGTRLQGLIGGAALVGAAFAASSLWWWIIRPQGEKERSFGGLWLIVGMILFLLLVAGDNFTYEYAYVRGFASEFAFLNDIIPPFLRGFRGMGFGLLLLGVFLAALPMTQTQRRIPWSGGKAAHSLLALAVTVVITLGVMFSVRPTVIQAVRDVDQIRIGTYNIHGGFNEFYHFDLEALARTIQQSGANVVLLQQVEAGRLTSFGVDQAIWLARRLGMAPRFFPTNEGLQGLAVLSNVEIVYDDGTLLTSVGQQTGLQRVQIKPDAGVITLYNTWLGFLLETGDGRTIEQQEQDQQRQMNEVLAIISAHHPGGNLGRMVIGGTFNNVPDSPLFDMLRAAGFRDPLAEMPSEQAVTFKRVGLPAVRLDYLWTTALTSFGTGVIDSPASDHRMAFIGVLIAR